MGLHEKVVKVVAEQLGIDESALVLDKPFTEQNGDSLDQIEIVMALEDEFGIQIEDDDGDNITTAQKAIDYLTPRVKA